MTRDEYLLQMQQLREEQVKTAQQHRENLELMEEYHEARKKEIIELQRAEDEDYRRKLKDMRRKRTDEQQDIERRMYELKAAWYREHPVQEIKLVEE